eukprot:Seg5763.1 transcript_id=Seg5763.1/GoldUCD/mRNA.D3Y31 product="Glycine receptor subunit alphaZ1" protein_id=Seg5763.1/GoldUCD/D3Y31
MFPLRREFLVLVIFSFAGKCLTIDKKSAVMSQFLRNLTNQGYDTRVRPTERVTNISTQIALLSLGPVNLQTTSISCDILLRHWWNDPRLAYDNKTELNFNGNPASIIWVPDTYISNGIKTHTHKGVTGNFRTKIGPNGDVYLSARLTIEFTCKMDFRYYPMDTQKCSMVVESYAYTGDEMTLSWVEHLNPINFVDDELEVTEYRIKKVQAVVARLIYLQNSSFTILKGIFHIERLFPHYLYHTYIPSMFLVSLSWSTFWIPSSAVPGRVTLITTNFLTSMFIFNNVGTSKPKVHYKTALEIFGLLNVIFIMMVMVEYVLVLKFPDFMKKKKNDTQSKKNNNQQVITVPLPEAQDALKSLAVALKSNSQEEPNETVKKEGNDDVSHIFDVCSRFLFPFVYAICVSVYFASYLMHD